MKAFTGARPVRPSRTTTHEVGTQSRRSLRRSWPVTRSSGFFPLGKGKQGREDTGLEVVFGANLVHPVCAYSAVMDWAYRKRPTSAPAKVELPKVQDDRKRRLEARFGQSSGTDAPSRPVLEFAPLAPLDFPSGPPPSSAQAANRASLAAEVDSLVRNSVSQSTLSTYEKTLESIIPVVRMRYGFDVLPCASKTQFYAIFMSIKEAFPARLGVGASTGLKVAKWSQVKAVYAALMYWHTAQGVPSVIHSWDDQLRAFWEGLKRQCAHDTRVKEPLAISDVESILQNGAKAASQVNAPQVPVWEKVRAPLLALRLAAEIAIAFFAVRRNSEAVALRLGDVFLPSDVSDWCVKVVRAKNDQLGKGHRAWVPHIPSWGEASPACVIQSWMKARTGLLVSLDKAGRLSSEPVDVQHDVSPPDILFPGLARNKWGFQVTPQALSGDLSKVVKGGDGSAFTPSPRKGGAKFYLTHDLGREEVQSQGGWRTKRSLEDVYGVIGSDELRVKVSQSAGRAARILKVRELIEFVRLLDLSSPFAGSPEEVSDEKSRVVRSILDLGDEISRESYCHVCPDFRVRVAKIASLWEVTEFQKSSLRILASRWRDQESRALKELKPLEQRAAALVKDTAPVPPV